MLWIRRPAQISFSHRAVMAYSLTSISCRVIEPMPLKVNVQENIFKCTRRLLDFRFGRPVWNFSFVRSLQGIRFVGFVVQHLSYWGCTWRGGREQVQFSGLDRIVQLQIAYRLIAEQTCQHEKARASWWGRKQSTGSKGGTRLGSFRFIRCNFTNPLAI